MVVEGVEEEGRGGGEPEESREVVIVGLGFDAFKAYGAVAELAAIKPRIVGAPAQVVESGGGDEEGFGYDSVGGV